MATLASATFREPALNSQFQIHRSQNWRLCWGHLYKVRCTLGLVHNCVFNCLLCLLYYCGLYGSSIDPNPDLGIPFLESSNKAVRELAGYTDMVETVCYVDVALWCVPVTLEFSQGEYGAPAWCREASTDLRNLN